MLNHILLMRLNNRDEKNVQRAKEVLLGLKGKIEQLKFIEVGTDVVHSEKSYDLALVSKFNSLEDLAIYRIHPEHLRVAEYLSQVVESSVCVDYELSDAD